MPRHGQCGRFLCQLSTFPLSAASHKDPLRPAVSISIMRFSAILSALSLVGLGAAAAVLREVEVHDGWSVVPVPGYTPAASKVARHIEAHDGWSVVPVPGYTPAEHSTAFRSASRVLPRGVAPTVTVIEGMTYSRGADRFVNTDPIAPTKTLVDGEWYTREADPTETVIQGVTYSRAPDMIETMVDGQIMYYSPSVLTRTPAYYRTRHGIGWGKYTRPVLYGSSTSWMTGESPSMFRIYSYPVYTKRAAATLRTASIEAHDGWSVVPVPGYTPAPAPAAATPMVARQVEVHEGWSVVTVSGWKPAASRAAQDDESLPGNDMVFSLMVEVVSTPSFVKEPEPAQRTLSPSREQLQQRKLITVVKTEVTTEHTTTQVTATSTAQVLVSASISIDGVGDAGGAIGVVAPTSEPDSSSSTTSSEASISTAF
ncbi:hypothetical protein K491DRAFT_778984 [Lophiostoma macrostomum CBS 122681]|uniref:Uncharacterized protein n=1 Tax=Lophiostoma macrostomum CBS 122681 TaxID=1314788 RepID=A0A6A6T583_9PLEO|nr:hypothetical protein K491DRAFT_778984 [Lophiostoma macrostomum CBS 122681]